jgi:hypothetical protein
VTRRWAIQGHDIEEFRGVIERHGLWRPDLCQFAEEAVKHRQPTLFDGVEAAPEDLPPAEVLPTEDLSAAAMQDAGWTLPPTTNGHGDPASDAETERNFAASRSRK